MNHITSIKESFEDRCGMYEESYSYSINDTESVCSECGCKIFKRHFNLDTSKIFCTSCDWVGVIRELITIEEWKNIKRKNLIERMLK